jgi:peptidoglycan/LPS O-acetylase OafA/YrhL
MVTRLHPPIAATETMPTEAGGTDQRSRSNYRADIDALRAMAVLPIVGFHLGFGFLGGGYVGVDIFFVISGYLIGSQVLRDLENRTYSVTDFYVRRMRRIVPALVTVLLATTAAVLLTLLPKATAAFGQSLLATTLFASNFFFSLNSSYFGGASEAYPLLHSWSLAVEEQFYITFPLIVFVVRSLGRRAIHLTLLSLAIVSFAISVWLTKSHPILAFYLLPTRLWELLLGVLALMIPTAALAHSRYREAVAAVAVMLIVGPILSYTADTPFPGLAALPPCLGTAMLLVAGSRGPTLVSRALSNKAMIFFGLISYSLYLWHWPVIVLLKQTMLRKHLSIAWQVAALLISILLAWLSWRYVERPWRGKQVTPQLILAASVISAAGLCAVGAALAMSGGAPGRFDRETVRLESILFDAKSNDLREGHCFLGTGASFRTFDKATCLHVDAGRPNILLMGDSHAAHLWSGLHRRFATVNFLQATAPKCKILLNKQGEGSPECQELRRYILKDYLNGHPIRWIIVAGQWKPKDLPAVSATIDWLKQQGYSVLLAGPVVTYSFPLPQVLAMARWHGDLSLAKRARSETSHDLDHQFETMAREHGVRYWSVYSALCRHDDCLTLGSSGLPLQIDNGHLTAEGSDLVAQSFPLTDIVGTGQVR